jgi:hypothetical protein
LSSEGVPKNMERNTLWKLLLGVSSVDKSFEISKSKRLKEQYNTTGTTTPDKELTSRIVSDIQRISIFKNDKRKKMKRVLTSYFNYHSIPYDDHFISLLEPFMESIHEEFEVYFSFEYFVENFILFKEHEENIKLGKFLLLFRSTQSSLYSLFEMEVISGEFLTEFLGIGAK